MSPPMGLTIGGSNPRKPQWKIGKRVGSGACASVHVLETKEGQASNWVVKVVPLPTKITKKKATIPERNARLLNYEDQLYRNTFPDYQGFIIPNLPPHIGPPAFGEIEKFRFLVMEKMKGPLWDLVPALLKPGSPSIGLAPILSQLLLCVENIHKEDHLVVDVKPENFMLAYTEHNRKDARKKKKGSKATAVAEDLAKKVRILDLGLVVPYKSYGGHRDDEGIDEIVGTPLYASLNVHAKHTPSRRDDMEALGYVVSELIIRLVATANGESDKFEGANEDDIPTYLPWSHEKSDDAIGKMKAKEVKNIKSKFYQRMGDKETAKAMKSLFDLTGSMQYKENPDYADFDEIFSSISVSVEPPKKKPAARSSPGRPTRASRTARAKRTASDEESSSPTKKQQKKKGSEEEEHFVDAAMEVDLTEDSDDEDEIFEDATEEAKEEEVFEDAEEMEWEPVKENRAKPSVGVGLGLIVTCDEGPHAGEHFELKRGEIETLVIGRNPRTSKPAAGEALWPLSRDDDADDTHVKLELKASRQLCSVNVSDLQSEGGTFVGSKQVSDRMRVFINDKFTIGNSTFRIVELAKSEQGAAGGADPPKKAKSTKSAKAKAPAKKPLQQKNEASKPAKARADVVLQVVNGPDKGESIELSQNGVQVINLGSKKSTAKKGEPVVLSDSALEGQHARFQLVASKKLMKVSVTDLSSESGTLINGKAMVKKEQMTFVGDRIKCGETVLQVKLA